MSNGNITALKVCNLEGWYDESYVLQGVNFHVDQGEVVTILGRNGAGKTTTLRSIMGMLRLRKGSINFEGDELIKSTPELIARKGIAICPEERGIFASLGVKDNLLLPPVVKPGGMSLEQIFRLFPNLEERLTTSQGTKLSGGEQQMLAIARILRTGAKTLLLDEPTEGLAPVIVQQIGNTIFELKKLGYTIVLVEQNLKFAMELADRHYVMERGEIVDHIERGEILKSEEKVKIYLGL